MTVRAHGVPVLALVGPVDPLLRVKFQLGIEMKPSVVPAVPGNGQALQSATGKGNQVLLQGKPAKGMSDLKIPHRAFRPPGVDKKTAVLAIKAGSHPLMFKNSVSKISQYGLVTGHGHGKGVM